MLKKNLNLKLFFFAKLFLFLFIINLKSYAENSQLKTNLTIGSENAAVKIKVFSSLTCPHCADFHTKVIPEIKKNYIDSGKVQLILIDFPLDQAGFNASKLLHCVDDKKKLTFLDTIYENQNEWTIGGSIEEINNNLREIVKNLGISSSQFDKCLNNEAISDKIINGRINGHQKYSINSTPTIVINEKKFEGSTSYNNIKKIIEKLI